MYGLQEVVALSDHCVSISKIHNYFHEAPKHMKQLGCDANSIYLPKKIYRKIFLGGLTTPN